MSSAPTPDLGKPQFASHSWLEPIVVVSIMFGSLYFNRRKNFSIFGDKGYDNADRSSRGYFDMDQDDSRAGSPNPLKIERFCGIPIKTPDSSRWAHNIHSRILYKFPFLVEMFYWALNFLFYSITKATAQWLVPADVGVVAVAQQHGEDVLWLEHQSAFRWMFPLMESDYQSFFMNYHPGIMTFFNRIYSLVHIPGTVLFLSWYYHEAPNSNIFAIARRTMTLGNFFAFAAFCVYPCMPPRLLPESYNFFDTVRQEHAESVWVGSKSVNQFAAMPSLHFTYAFVISSTFLYHSELLRRLRGKPTRKSTITQITFATLAVLYSCLVLSVIVATANHYWLDAVMAMISVTVCFMINRVFLLLLPAEYFVCWALRLAKPLSNVGGNKNDDKGSLSPRYRTVPGYDV